MKIRFACVLALSMLLGASQARAEGKPSKLKVAWVPLAAEAGDARQESIRAAVTDTLTLNLGLVPNYTVIEARGLDPYGRFDLVKRYADQNGVDYVIFGRVSSGRSGEIEIQMSVYSRAKKAVSSTRRESSAGVFGVFAASNRLVSSVVKDISGVAVGFGSLEIANTGEDGDYEVYVDHESLGTNLTSARRVFNGPRLVRVVQKRMLGEESIFSKEVKIADGKTTRVEFAVPYLLEREKALLEKLEGTIDELGTRRGETARVLGTFGELLALFADVSYCRRLEEERERIRQEEAEYVLATIAWEIEDGLFDPKEETLDRLLGIWGERTTYLDPGKVERKTMENAQFLFSAYDLNASRDLSMGDWARAAERYRVMERIVRAIPLSNLQDFEEDRKFVEKTWRKYDRKNQKSETFAEIGIGVKVAKHFKEKIEGAERFFRDIDKIERKELLLIAYPPGVDTIVEGKPRGKAPVRVKGIGAQTAQASIQSPWFSKEPRVFPLEGPRTVAYLPGSAESSLSVNPTEAAGKGRVRLSWSEMPGAKSYLLQVDEAGGDFEKPVEDLKNVRDNEVYLDKNLKRNTSYVYRVKAVGDDGGESGWAYSEPFQGF